MTAWSGTDSRRAVYNRGRHAEQTAVDYLQQQGLELLQRNYRCNGGEIDIIMRNNQTLVFVEVRYRANDKFCHAIETINSVKQKRIRASAQHYLQTHQDYRHHDCRFDVITLHGSETPSIDDWLKNAF